MATDADGVENDDTPSAGAYAAQPTTTAEAQSFSRRILNRELSGATQGNEQAILDEMQQHSQKAVQALQAAQQSISQQQYDPRLRGLGFAEAVMGPTRSGTTAEGLGKGFGAVHDDILAEQKFNLARQQAMAQYGLAIPEEEEKLTQAKMDLQKLHEQQEGPLARSALTVLGRSIAKQGAGSASSPFGKIAHDEGLIEGTPAFTARVTQLTEADLKDKAARAGVDADTMTPDERAELAKQYGVPTTAPYPWQGLSTKQQTAAMQAERAKALTELQKSDEAVLQNRLVEDSLDRFMFLNHRTATSSWQGVPGIHFATGFGDDSKEMDKISSRLGPLMRQPGMGRMTNYDLQTFMASTVGRDKPFAVNNSIAQFQKASIDNQMAYNEFAHNYFAVHKTLEGARDVWDSYLDKNPVWDPKATPGSMTPNKARQDYKSYFRSQAVGPSAPVTPPSLYPDVTEADRRDPVFAGSTDEEIHRYKNTPGAHARGGPIRGYAGGGPVSQEDDYHATLEDLARSLEQGASFQWGDELNAGLHPGSYAQNVQHERGMQERFSSTHPYANTGLEIAGGAGAGMAAGKLGQIALEHMKGKAGGLGALAALVEKYTPKSFIGKSAAIGAGAGAVAGAGSAQDVQSIPGTAAQQALLGAVTGPIAGLATKYGVNGAMVLLDKLRGAGIPAGSKKVLDALTKDQTTVDEIRARLAKSGRLGVPSNVGDVGDANVRALAQAVATKPGPKVGQYVSDLADRQATSGDRVTDLVNKALKPDDYTDKLKDLTTALYQNAKPLYEQAYAQFPKVKSDTIFDILGTKFGKTAGKRAYQLMQADQVPIGQTDAAGFLKKPSLQYLDYVKRALDDQVTSARNAGDTNLARIVGGMRDRLKNELDTITQGPNGQPGPYQAARAQYAGDLEVRDALKMGRDEFGRMTPRDLANATANMSYAEKDALRTGAAENLFQQIASTPANANAAAKLANIPSVQQKLGTLFDKPSDYNKFMDALQQEMQNFNQSRQIISTAMRARTGEAAAGLDPTGHLGEAAAETVLAPLHPAWAGARAARWVGNKMMPSDTAEQAASMLGTTNGPQGAAALDILKRQAAQLGNRQNMATSAGLTAAGGLGPVSAPDPWGNMAQQGGP
jgi:hypothetical protein